MTAPHELTGKAAADLLTDGGGRDKILVTEAKTGSYPYGMTTGDGLLVSNAYWIAPARWFKPAWDYLLPEGQGITPGVWEVRWPEGNRGRRPFLYRLEEMSSSMVSTFRGYTLASQYAIELEPERVHGHQAAVRWSSSDYFVAVFHRPATINDPPQPVGIRTEYLDALTADRQPSSLSTPYGYRYGDEVSLRQMKAGPMGAVGIFVNRTKVTDGHYEGELGSPERRFVGREEKPEGPKLAAVVMPQRWPDQKD
jgi:hypothetical protein